MQKVALVTGGSKGIGYAAAKALYQMGYVVIVAARNEQQLVECAQGLDAERFVPIAVDVTDPQQVEALFQRISTQFGRWIFCLITRVITVRLNRLKRSRLRSGSGCSMLTCTPASSAPKRLSR